MENGGSIPNLSLFPINDTPARCTDVLWPQLNPKNYCSRKKLIQQPCIIDGLRAHSWETSPHQLQCSHLLLFFLFVFLSQLNVYKNRSTFRTSRDTITCYITRDHISLVRMETEFRLSCVVTLSHVRVIRPLYIDVAWRRSLPGHEPLLLSQCLSRFQNQVRAY